MDNNPNPKPTDPLQPHVVEPVLPPQSPAPVVLAQKPPEDDHGAKGDVGSGGGFGEFISTIGILLTALAVAVLMILFVFRSYQVDGPSMQSTLQNADKLIIWKVPRTIARITHHTYIPNRGDVIVFTESGLSAFGQSDTKQLIKRVVGLPGERVVVASGVVTIFNKAHPTGFQPDKTLPYGKVIPNTSGDVDVTLRPGQVFVCGDNRPDSLDSRAFGPIDANQIIGKLVLRVFPLGQAKAF
ncbi:MAG: signal peptidase [Candidatus Saccharibacteria bacterium]|nr:signal peptidase [Candidatus Saccharibacteria bacterium]